MNPPLPKADSNPTLKKVSHESKNATPIKATGLHYRCLADGKSTDLRLRSPVAAHSPFARPFGGIFLSDRLSHEHGSRSAGCHAGWKSSGVLCQCPLPGQIVRLHHFIGQRVLS